MAATMASGLVRVALLAHFVALGRAATHSPPASSSLQAEPGAQLQGFDDDIMVLGKVRPLLNMKDAM